MSVEELLEELVNKNATSEEFKRGGCIKFAVNMVQTLGQGQKEQEFWKELSMVEQHLKEHKETPGQTIVSLKRDMDRHNDRDVTGYVLALINPACEESTIEHQWMVLRIGQSWYMLHAFNTKQLEMEPTMTRIKDINEHLLDVLRLSAKSNKDAIDDWTEKYTKMCMFQPETNLQVKAYLTEALGRGKVNPKLKYKMIEMGGRDRMERRLKARMDQWDRKIIILPM